MSILYVQWSSRAHRRNVELWGVFKNNIAGLDAWFSNSEEMCQYLNLKDSFMNCSVVNQAEFDKKQMQKTERKIGYG